MSSPDDRLGVPTADVGTLRLAPPTGRYTAPFKFIVHFTPRGPRADDFFTPFGATQQLQLHHGSQLLLTVEDVDKGDLLLAARPVQPGYMHTLEAGNYHVLAALVSRGDKKLAACECLYEIASPFVILDESQQRRGRFDGFFQSESSSSVPALPRRFPTPPAEQPVAQFEEVMRVADAAQKGVYLDLRQRLVSPEHVSDVVSPTRGDGTHSNSKKAARSPSPSVVGPSQNRRRHTSARPVDPLSPSPGRSAGTAAFARRPAELRSGEFFSFALDVKTPTDVSASPRSPVFVLLDTSSPASTAASDRPLLLAPVTAVFEGSYRAQQMPARGATISWAAAGAAAASKRGSVLRLSGSDIREGRIVAESSTEISAGILMAAEHVGSEPSVSVFSGLSFQLDAAVSHGDSDVFVAFREYLQRPENSDGYDNGNDGIDEFDVDPEDGALTLDLRRVGPSSLPYMHITSTAGSAPILAVKQAGRAGPLFEARLGSPRRRMNDASTEYSLFLRTVQRDTGPSEHDDGSGAQGVEGEGEIGPSDGAELVMGINGVEVFRHPLEDLGEELLRNALRPFVSLRAASRAGTAPPHRWPALNSVALLSHMECTVLAVDTAVLNFSTADAPQMVTEDDTQQHLRRTSLGETPTVPLATMLAWVAGLPVLTAASATVFLPA